MISAEDEEFGKPHPSVFITAARELEIAPQDCLVFEDSLNGVISGKAACMKVIAVPPSNLINDPKYGIADLLLDSLAEFGDQDFDRLLS